MMISFDVIEIFNISQNLELHPQDWVFLKLQQWTLRVTQFASTCAISKFYDD